ncbi:hypothetical protein BYT27DRAFT_7197257 [Phlegmacium glaucopus]|nr:hypothetical protein BYT27DRAFT_7197257 [Phlegmacium glaucopus]
MEISTEMAFNVNHLLNTNSTPSPEQRNHLQNFILQLDEAILNTDEDISAINEQILSMQNKIIVMQTRRARLVQQRRGYSSLLSPVRCLPIELFGKIFVYATRDSPRHVLNLSAVCQLWRYAALNTPALWSTLELGHETSTCKMINHVNSWIERARSYPLSLTIRNLEDSWDPDHSILALLDDHQCQWKSITLDSDNREGLLLILKKLKFSNLEMLESFSLNIRFSDRELALPGILQLGYTSKLKTLSLSINHHVTFYMLPFPWRQLTSLTISFWDASNINLDILQACENLEEFIIYGNYSSGSSDSTITLNYLRKLHTHSPSTFLRFLKTPSIQDLALKASGFKYLKDQAFYDYITSNGLTLLKLSIAPSNSQLIQSIPALQSLVELKLYDNDYYENGSTMMYDILNSLIVDPEMDPSTIPLPRLETLEIICQATEENQRMFMKVIDSRWWSDEEENRRQKQGEQSLSRIKYAVLMNVHTELNMFCRNDVDDLRAQGMKIEYLAPFDGMDKDDFYISSFYS